MAIIIFSGYNSLLIDKISNNSNDLIYVITRFEDLIFSTYLNEHGEAVTNIMQESELNLSASDVCLNLSHLDLHIDASLYSVDDYFYTKTEYAASLNFILYSHNGKVINRPNLAFPFLQLNTFDVRSILKYHDFQVIKDTFIQGKNLKRQFEELKGNYVTSNQDEQEVFQLINKNSIDEKTIYTITLIKGYSNKTMVVKLIDEIFIVSDKLCLIDNPSLNHDFFNSYFTFIGLDIALLIFFESCGELKFGKFTFDFSYIKSAEIQTHIANIISKKLLLL